MSRASSRASRLVIRNESRIADRDDLVADVLVVGLRPEVLADALDQIGTAGPARVDRAFRVGADDLHPAAGHLLEVPAGARDRAPGADARHEVGDLPLGLRPDLRAGGAVVRGGVLRVGVLVGLPAARGLAGQPVGDRVVGVRMVRGDGGRADHDLGTVGAQHADLVLRHLVRADKQALIALLRRGDGQPDPGVARGGLDDGAARLQFPEASAASIMASAIRSFTDPPGLKYSTLASTAGAAAPPSSSWRVTLRSRTSGVFPMRSISDSCTCMPLTLLSVPPTVSHPRSRPGPARCRMRRAARSAA